MIFEKYRIKLSHYLFDTEKTGYNEHNATPLEEPYIIELTIADNCMRQLSIKEIADYLIEKLKEVI